MWNDELFKVKIKKMQNDELLKLKKKKGFEREMKRQWYIRVIKINMWNLW
jgi:hypothetical protein